MSLHLLTIVLDNLGAQKAIHKVHSEEIVSPALSEVVFMVDGGYGADEVLKAETFMLSLLDFSSDGPDH